MDPEKAIDAPPEKKGLESEEDKEMLEAEGNSMLESGEEEELLEGPQEQERIEAEERKKMIERDQPGILDKGEGAKLKELEERFIRLSAEFENFRKRSQKENLMVRENANASLMQNLLEILDEFDMAMDMKGSCEDDFSSGMQMIYAKLYDVLERQGLSKMECLGKPFDPHRHEAIGFEEGPENEILKVALSGYTFKGKVLRYAKVIIGKNE
jgi:molecular chaperone GrpE